jgi:hypothetical protein
VADALEILANMGYDLCACGKPKRVAASTCRECWKSNHNNGASGTKYCAGCDRALAVNQFSWNTSKNSYRSRCKDCESKQRKEQNERDKMSGASRKSDFRKNWKRLGFNPKDVETFVEEHEGICDICGTSENLAIDHCHQTNVLRGLLCMSCNVGLGHFRDSPDRLARAILYITKNRSAPIVEHSD